MGKPQKRKRLLKKEESTAIAVAQLIQLSEDEESEKGKVEHNDGKPNSDSPFSTTKCSEKPKKAISSFFAKVTKEERLAKSEVLNTKIEVKAMIHQSTEADSLASVCDDVSVGQLKDGEVGDGKRDETGSRGDLEGGKVA